MRGLWKRRECVLVVEVKQNNGRWEPFACIDQRPFTPQRARERKAEVLEKFPHLAHKTYRGRVRINVYVPIQFVAKMSEVALARAGKEAKV